jgi:hypothetical protein
MGRMPRQGPMWWRTRRAEKGPHLQCANWRIALKRMILRGKNAQRGPGTSSLGRTLVPPPRAAALVQPTDEPADHEHGHPESGDHAHADEHIGKNEFGTGVEGHIAVSRANGRLSSPAPVRK